MYIKHLLHASLSALSKQCSFVAYTLAKHDYRYVCHYVCPFHRKYNNKEIMTYQMTNIIFKTRTIWNKQQLIIEMNCQY